MTRRLVNTIWETQINPSIASAIYATFWPSLNKVEVRVFAETGSTTELSNLWYTATVTTGSASPATAYTADLTGGANNKLHWVNTAWTKRFWIGAAPSNQVNINYGLGYLAKTKYVLNYDTTITVAEGSLSNNWSAFQSRVNDIYDGKWNGKSWVNRE